MITQDQFKEISLRVETLKESLNIEQLQIELKEGQIKVSDPLFWDNIEFAQSKLKEIKSIELKLDKFNSIKTTLDELEIAIHYNKNGLDCGEDIDNLYSILNNSLESMEFINILNNPEDSMDCVLQINAGAGGTEAQDWAEMLLRMYVRWAEKHDYKVCIINRQDGDVAGIKTATIEIIGKSYGYLKGENGIHRLVRVSPFNAQGKRMTSFASVFVTPLIDDSIEINIDPSKLKVEFFRCSGAGGQNVNKVETGVRLRYIFEDQEIVVENTEARRQHDNRENAMRILKSRLYDIELKKKQKERDEIESNKLKIEWGSQIRSYVFDDRRVKDHRTNYQTTDVDNVMNGDIDDFIKSYIMFNNE